MCTSVFVLSLLITCAVAGEENENQAHVRFYEKSFNNYTELPLNEAHKMFSGPWYDRNKKFCLFAHGFTGTPLGPAVTAVTTSFIKTRKYNVAILNWEKLAALIFPGVISSYLYWAVPNAQQLGADFAETLLKWSNAGLNLNNTHFVGHSLGAHLLGVTGNTLMKKGVQLPWITGLDPATGFDSKSPHLRLNSGSALFTATVNTDPSKFGTKKNMGLVNFWPNYRAVGSVKQPGCYPGGPDTFSSDDFCSHHRAWQLFVDAMEYPGTILGSHAHSYKAWKRYNKEEKEATVAEVGVMDLNYAPGDYYFLTSDVSPYGLGKDGL